MDGFESSRAAGGVGPPGREPDDADFEGVDEGFKVDEDFEGVDDDFDGADTDAGSLWPFAALCENVAPRSAKGLSRSSDE